MPAKTPAKVLLACPHCGNQQAEPPSAISSVCKKCGKHFHVQDVLHPTAKAVERAPDKRHITCFECQAELDIPASAESTMCKKCSRYIDLKNYTITSAVSKNFKTKGDFVIEPKGYVFNTEIVAGHVVLKGRLLGKICAEQSLTIHSTAEIKGSFKTAKLIIPEGNLFRWTEPLAVVDAELAGEFVGTLIASGTVIVKATARMFGEVTAKSCLVEAGAVVVGNLKIGGKT
jgi:cytoskeletal protein CcmA (bactofilin family)